MIGGRWPVSSAVLHDLGATASGLLFIVIGAALYGPAPWSALRLLRTDRQATATVVKARPGGMSRGSPGPGGYAVDRHYPPSLRLAFTLDGRRREMTLRLAEPGAETGYAHGDFEQLLGACLMLGGIGWLVAYAVGF